MAFVSAKNLRPMIMEGLITPYDPDRAQKIEGSKYDLTVGKIFRERIFSRVPTIGARHREIPSAVPVKGQGRDLLPWYGLWPGVSYLVQSQETVNMPPGMMGLVVSRTSIFRSHARVVGAVIDPGYMGLVTVALNVKKWNGMWLQQGARFCSIVFAHFDDLETDDYIGIWGGDKLTTDGVERAF